LAIVVPLTKIRSSFSVVYWCIFFLLISCRKDFVFAEGLVFTFPATDGWVAVVPAFDTTLLVDKGGGFDFITVFLGISYCKK
jgi:hypothetical protein